MIDKTLRTGVTLAAAVFALASAGFAGAAVKAPLPPIDVVGVDDVCSGFTPSVDPGTGGVVLTCIPASTAPGAPTGCVATISPASLGSAGGTVNLNVTGCQSASSLTYSWTRSGVANWKATAATSDSLGPNSGTTAVRTTYRAQVCAESACANTNEVTATVAGVPTAPPGGGTAWNGTCDGYANTRVLDVNWANPTRLSTVMGPNDAVVVRFTTGAGSSTSSGKVAAAEWGSAPSSRVGVLSETPCDFGPQDSSRAASAGTSVTVRFYVADTLISSSYPVVLPKTTYYFNIRNGASPTCASNGVCDIFVDFSKPAGL